MQYIESTYSSHDGLTLFYRDYRLDRETRTPVICLHGLTRNSRDFEFLARRLSNERRVICPDLRGRGFSDWDENYANYQPAVYIADLIELLRVEDISRAVIIGTSLGGFMAMIMAASRPDLVEAIIINDVGPEVDPKGIERILKYAGAQGPFPSWEKAIDECRRTYEHALPGLSEDEWAEFARQSYRENSGGEICPDMDPKIREAMREAEAAPNDLWALFSALNGVPALAIRGADSDILSEDTLERMAVVKPDLKTAVIPDRGHAPMLTEPAAWEAIEKFLAKVG